jgi:hypothetical protein
MKASLTATALLVLLAGCETFEETYLIEQDVIIEEQNVRVTSDLEEDFFGASWFQFRAYNGNAFPVCVRVSLESNSYTSGHAMGQAYLIASYQTVDIGYIHNPSDFAVDAHVYSPSGGSC